MLLGGMVRNGYDVNLPRAIKIPPKMAVFILEEWTIEDLISSRFL